MQSFLQGQSTFIQAEIRAYNIKELCSLYNVSRKTFSKWLKPFEQQIGQRQGRYYTVVQVERIFMHIGIPYSLF